MLHEPVSLIPTQTVTDSTPARIGNRRWLICGLLFFAATVNYMDRQVIALLKPMLQVQFGWTEVGYSNIVTAFSSPTVQGCCSSESSSTGSARVKDFLWQYSSGARLPWPMPLQAPSSNSAWRASAWA